MARHIDADKIIDTVCVGISCHECSFGFNEDGASECVLGKRIDDFPTADVRENVIGEWIDREVIDDRKDAKIQQWQQAQCSICGKWHTTPYMYYFDDYNFCPNCGSYNGGKKDENR